MSLAMARPYAEAAFRFAKQSGEVTHWQAFLQAFAKLVKDPSIQTLLHNPFIEQNKVAEIFIEQDAKKNIAQHHFLKLLAEHRRLAALPDISSYFDHLHDQDENIACVNVTTAYPLNASTEKNLQEKLEARLQKNIRMETGVNANLIGGLQIRIGDRLLDASIQGQLKQLNQDLSRGS